MNAKILTLDERNNKLFEQLVSCSGKSETREGEMLRAINKIQYRMWNDGDHFDKGYGIETAGSAHAFLILIDTPIRTKLIEVFTKAENQNDEKYSALVVEALEIIVSYIESLKGNYTKNEVDMYDYKPLFEEEKNYYDDEEDEEDDE